MEPTPIEVKEDLRSVYTAGLPNILAQLNISLAVSTYQANKVILIRSDVGASVHGPPSVGTINTHFRNYRRPMGLAARGHQLAIGGQKSIWELHNLPAVARKLELAPGRARYDACYVPRRMHITVDIDIHEMAYAGNGELWFVNTRFGCLCTLDAAHSFYPRWRPPFVSAYAPEDRCHLNGLAMVDGRAKFVTALGATDTPGGWRDNKVDGGLLMDIESNQAVLRGLSMPHSPRWYHDRLWFLESGTGSLKAVDLGAGRMHTIANLPGFTRGLDFYGPLAFVGLSQVRDSATFSNLPLLDNVTERACGVWIVHIESGQTVGFLRFESGVQEIFAVQVLPNTRFPEMLEWEDERVAFSYELPDAALVETPAAEWV